jgi:hypothetical protein
MLQLACLLEISFLDKASILLIPFFYYLSKPNAKLLITNCLAVRTIISVNIGEKKEIHGSEAEYKHGTVQELSFHMITTTNLRNKLAKKFRNGGIGQRQVPQS